MNLEVDLQKYLLEAIATKQGLTGMIGGAPSNATVLMSGLPGSIAAAVSRELTSQGVERERVLFCDYF